MSDSAGQKDMEPNSYGSASASQAISAKRIADDTRRAADAIVEYLSFLKERDALVQHLRKNMADNLRQQDGTVVDPYNKPKGTHGDGLPADDH